MNRICMMCGDHNPDDGLLCAGCRVTAKEWPEKAIAKLTQNNAARQNIIEQMAKRINELEAMVAKAVAIIDYDASERLVELDAISTIQPESQPLGSHYEYVEGCKP